MERLARGCRPLAIVCGLLWLAGGCQEDVFVQAPPVMQLGADRLEFGAVAVGQQASQRLSVQNAGLSPLRLNPVVDDDPTSAFGLTAFDERIQPGTSGELEVTFHPSEIGRFSAWLRIEGNDPDNRQALVALGGDGYRRGAIEVIPQEVDFGLVDAGKVGLGQVAIRNVGNGALTVTGVALTPQTNPDFGILGSTQTPIEIDSGGERLLNLAYRPGLHSLPPAPGTLVVEAADPFQPRTEVRLLADLNRAPVADAGPDREVDPLDTVVLDGSGSQDPDGDLPLAFQWRVVRLPEGSGAVLSPLDPPRVALVPDLVGVYEAELQVTDATGLGSLLPDRVTVTAIPAERILLELVWDSPIADLDLHLLAPGGVVGSALDCFYSNRTPDWGTPGDPADDPVLLRDDLAGFGPETIGYANPLGGAYELAVVFFAAHTPSGREPTTATLRVFVDGLLAAEMTRNLDAQGQTWRVARVDWPEGTVHAIDTIE